MAKFAQGSDVVLDIYIYDREGGNLVDPDGYPATEPTVTVIDQYDVTKVSSDLNTTRLGIGHFEYTYTLANDAPIGTQWRYIWGLTINGVVLAEAERTEYFEVVDAGYVTFDNQVTVQDIRDFLEGYGVTSTQLSDTWIQNRKNRFVIPYVQRICRQSFFEETQVTEYYNGNGKNVLQLNRRNVSSLDEIEYVISGDYQTYLSISNIELVGTEGKLKAKTNYSENYFLPIFAKGNKNLKVTYTYGYEQLPSDVKDAIIYLCAEQILGFIGARTGGGSVGVQGFNRGYGERGKYQDIRNDLNRQAHAILSNYMTRVVGG